MGEHTSAAASGSNPTAATLRIDRWLCNVRLFKTRSAAVAALAAGRVQLNGSVAKAARGVKIGDRVRIVRGDVAFEFAVRGVAARRVSPAAARELVCETTASADARAARTNATPAARPQQPARDARRTLARLKRTFAGEDPL